jgi:hypothetical protein
MLLWREDLCQLQVWRSVRSTGLDEPELWRACQMSVTVAAERFRTSASACNLETYREAPSNSKGLKGFGLF